MPNDLFDTGLWERLRTDRHLDSAIAYISARQHGVVHAEQLAGLGLSRGAARRRARRGALHEQFPAVYSVGDPLISLRGRWLAAVLACRPDSTLSYAAATALRGFTVAAPRLIDVTASHQRGRKLPGIRRHHATALRERDRAVVDGIPVTSVARTLLDFASIAGGRRLERAFIQAVTLRQFDKRELDDVLARAGCSPGTARLRALCEHAAPVAQTRSGLEESFLALIDRAGLPRPELNVRLPIPGEEITVDAYWPAQRLGVEIDSAAYHDDNPLAFVEDRRRDRALRLHGYGQPVRFTDEDIGRRPDRTIAELSALLSRRAAR